jgi:hypothetical protein
MIIKSKLMLHLFQENKSYGVKTIAFILCLHVAVHHVQNTNIQYSLYNISPNVYLNIPCTLRT